ncbi:MAG: SRPBCC family protein [Gemmatimonadaceae bacterium]|nr:SRPBCC family protein [Gemmatimonadaceae bacterium]
MSGRTAKSHPRPSSDRGLFVIKQLLFVILVIVGIVALAALRRPDSFRVERSITINAPPARIFPLVNDFQQFGKWSPWEHLDPGMTRAISTPSAGTGASYAWSGNRKAGAGRMEIIESVPGSRVKATFTFLKPIPSQNTAEYTLVPSGSATTVTFRMYGPSPFLSRVMQVFVSMDDLLGKDFEKGLAAMKVEAERPQT